MIQRQQTVHLLMVALLGIALFFLPVYHAERFIHSELETFHVSLTEVVVEKRMPEISTQHFPQLPAQYMNIFMVAGALGTIFFFKNRPLQALCARGLVFLAIGLFALLLGGVWKFAAVADFPLQTGATRIGLYIPIAMVVFAFLALRGIRADIALVRSANRIR